MTAAWTFAFIQLGGWVECLGDPSPDMDLNLIRASAFLVRPEEARPGRIGGDQSGSNRAEHPGPVRAVVILDVLAEVLERSCKLDPLGGIIQVFLAWIS